MATTIRDVRTGKAVVYYEIASQKLKGVDVVRGRERWSLHGRKKWHTITACKDAEEASRLAVMLDSGGNWKRNGDIIVDDGSLPRRHKPEDDVEVDHGQSQ